MTFAERIRELRKSKGYSYRKVHEITGFDYSNLSKIEKGRLNPPDAVWVIRLANALDADVVELLELSEAPREILELARGSYAVPVAAMA
jgi:transcriptional regulator with XRE-family HTH domain